jgi:hypothetical protein
MQVARRANPPRGAAATPCRRFASPAERRVGSGPVASGLITGTLGGAGARPDIRAAGG